MANNTFGKASIKMPRIFSNNMVLQRDVPLRIWGKASPGEKITVSIHRQSKTADADHKGNWNVILAPLEAGGPHELHVEGNTRTRYSNVMTGDVWIASGQSNMYWPVRLSDNHEKEINNANYPEIRLFSVPQRMSLTPEHDLEYGEWLECSPETVADFSAVAYFFGRYLNHEMDIPVGLIHASWSGTVAETWISRASMASHPDFAAVSENNHLTSPDDPNAYPSLLFNGMIRALTPFVIKGAIWYQGEANTSRHKQYQMLFPMLINDWREQWQNPGMPFYFVQLANYMQPDPSPADSDWARLREAQAMALSLSKTGMAVAIDIGESNNIHPSNKQDVGLRLALIAMKKTYGKDLTHSGPFYKTFIAEGSTIRIQFDTPGEAMVARGSKGLLKGFAIAGRDKMFAWAEAEIIGNEIVVKSHEVNQPIAVRYAWGNNPADANLYNTAGLPAPPFRTDDW